MKKINEEILSKYLMLSILVTIALAAAMQVFIIKFGFSSFYTAKMLTLSLPLAIPYANIISLAFMMIYLFFN